MRIIRASSLEEYADWYLRREARKEHDQPIPCAPGQQVQEMWATHPGKMRQWFPASTTRWHVMSLETVTDLADLVFLESGWTKEEGLVTPNGINYRLLGRVAEIARVIGYLQRPSAHKHKAYYDRLAEGALLLNGEEGRVAICSAESSEISTNPQARYYLLDGVGRCLPYMMLVADSTLRYAPIEAFLAEK